MRTRYTQGGFIWRAEEVQGERIRMTRERRGGAGRRRTLRVGLAVLIAAAAGCRGRDAADLALRDFRPKPKLVVPQHLFEKSRFPCVNMHSHLGRFSSAEQVDDFVAVMDRANVAVTVSLDGMWGEELTRRIGLFDDRHPGRVCHFARLDWRGQADANDRRNWAVNKTGWTDRTVAQLEDSVRRGAVGLKISKGLGLYYRDAHGELLKIDDPRLDPIWAKCGELKIPVLIHTADPAAFFDPLDETNERYEELSRHPGWHFHGKGFPPRGDLLDARNRVIERHPDTTFIGAHMANNPEDLAQVGGWLDRHSNLVVEISARVAELGRQPYTARRFFLKHADRIMFGTDGVPPLSELVPHWRFLETWDEYFDYEDNPFPPQGLWRICGIALPDAVLRKIYYENALRVVGGIKWRPEQGPRPKKSP